jgi:hypothetical protein
MTILRYILALTLVVVFIHFFEVFKTSQSYPSPQISPDTLLVLDSLRSLEKDVFDLRVEEQFWKNRIQLAGTSPFILTVNLKDSLVTLDLKGVPVHQAKIEGIQLSRGISDSLHQTAFYNWIRSPFVIRSQTATVLKVPVQERYIASRKEAESQLIHLREPEDSTYASIMLDFDRGLDLTLKETEPDSICYPLFPEVSPDHGKQITLYLARIDVLTIYRAISDETRLVLLI